MIHKQHQIFNHAWNHISDHPNMTNGIISRQKKGIFSAIYNFLFGLTDSHDVKQLKKNVAILMQNQNLQQSLKGMSIQASNVTCIHLAKIRHTIHGLVDALKSINNTTYNNHLATSSLNFARNFLITLDEIGHR